MGSFDAVLTASSITGNTLSTFVQRIINEVGRASTKDEESIKMAMITAMRHYSDLRLWFKEETVTFDVTADQQSYGISSADSDGYPSDFISPVTAYYLVGGTRWLLLEQVDIATIRFLTATEEVVGVPTQWAWYNDKIWLTPIPSVTSDNEQVRLDYIQDTGIPTYYWDGTGWAFKGPQGEPLLNAWSSPWLDGTPEELLRARTKWDLYFNYYDDAENAMKMGGYDGEGGLIENAYNAVIRRHNRPKYNVVRRTTYV